MKAFSVISLLLLLVATEGRRLGSVRRLQNDKNNDKNNKNDKNNNKNQDTTEAPTSSPTSLPTREPTGSPTVEPTLSPTTGTPTGAPALLSPTSSPEDATTTLAPAVAPDNTAMTTTAPVAATTTTSSPVAPPVTTTTTTPANNSSTAALPLINFWLATNTAVADEALLESALEQYLRDHMLFLDNLQSVDLDLLDQQEEEEEEQDDELFLVYYYYYFQGQVVVTDDSESAVQAEQEAVLLDTVQLETALRLALNDPDLAAVVYLDSDDDSDDQAILESAESGINTVLVGAMVGVAAILSAGAILQCRHQQLQKRTARERRDDARKKARESKAKARVFQQQAEGFRQQAESYKQQVEEYKQRAAEYKAAAMDRPEIDVIATAPSCDSSSVGMHSFSGGAWEGYQQNGNLEQPFESSLLETNASSQQEPSFLGPGLGEPNDDSFGLFLDEKKDGAPPVEKPNHPENIDEEPKESQESGEEFQQNVGILGLSAIASQGGEASMHRSMEQSGQKADESIEEQANKSLESSDVVSMEHAKVGDVTSQSSRVSLSTKSRFGFLSAIVAGKQATEEEQTSSSVAVVAADTSAEPIAPSRFGFLAALVSRKEEANAQYVQSVEKSCLNAEKPNQCEDQSNEVVSRDDSVSQPSFPSGIESKEDTIEHNSHARVLSHGDKSEGDDAPEEEASSLGSTHRIMSKEQTSEPNSPTIQESELTEKVVNPDVHYVQDIKEPSDESRIKFSQQPKETFQAVRRSRMETTLDEVNGPQDAIHPPEQKSGEGQEPQLKKLSQEPKQRPSEAAQMFEAPLLNEHQRETSADHRTAEHDKSITVEINARDETRMQIANSSMKIENTAAPRALPNPEALQERSNASTMQGQNEKHIMEAQPTEQNEPHSDNRPINTGGFTAGVATASPFAGKSVRNKPKAETRRFQQDGEQSKRRAAKIPAPETATESASDPDAEVLIEETETLIGQLLSGL